MLVRELRKLQLDLERIAAEPVAARRELESLGKANERICALLVKVSSQLDAWQQQLDTRNDLQQLVADVVASSGRVKTMWWKEQLHFYETLGEEIREYFQDESDEYMSVSLTALELLLVIRLCIDVGILRTDSLQTVFGFLSKHTRTVSQGRLSFESLKKRYSLRHEGARKHVKQLLLDMIRRIDRPSPEE